MKAIKVEGIGKKYDLTKNRDSTLNGTFKNLFRGRQSKEEFWALKDVSFEVQQGESLGIIGKNGAGKSTLLKILSKIIYPTTGQASINGKVASLLEIGTGFHPELTGRENIFLNGSLLGMSKKEIKLKLDQIIDFSGVEKFIDMPVKHYSSGMYVRLGFSVAAYLNAEILIVDEVLSVGDLEFQDKCINSINSINKSGRTILLVSHNLGVIKNLCRNSICLENGELIASGTTSKVINQYINKVSTDHVTLEQGPINKISFKGSSTELEFRVHYKLSKLVFPNLDAIVSNQFGQPLFGSNSRYEIMEQESSYPNYGVLIIKFENVSLRSGKYYFSLWFGNTKAGYNISLKDVLLFHHENLEVRAGNLDTNHYGQIIPKFDLQVLDASD